MFTQPSLQKVALETKTTPILSTDKKKISTDKQKFLDEKKFASKNISAKEAKHIAEHYQKKGIKIFINGETEYGQMKIEAKRTPLRIKFAELKDDSIKYARLLADKLGKRNGLKVPTELKLHVREFLTTNNEIKPDLSLEKSIAFNEICSQSGSKKILDEQVSAYRQQLEDDIEDCCLSKKECLEEIDLIKKSLEGSDQAVGYVFTNNHYIRKGHFEVLIITQDKIIKPVQWGDGSPTTLNPAEFTEIYHIPVDPSFVEMKSSTAKGDPHILPKGPQSSLIGCGSLGILYLKQLLKNKGKQLKEFSLCIPYYNSKEKLCYMFVPPPQPLCYSKSNIYNKMIKARLNTTPEEGHVEIKHGEKIMHVVTLETILKKSIVIAKAKGETGTPVIKHNTDLLLSLNAFRERWYAEYDVAVARNIFFSGIDEFNLYLSYCTQRLFAIANPARNAPMTLVVTPQCLTA